jgi:hypothetical protein
MKRASVILLCLAALGGCASETPVETSKELKEGPKLSKEEAAKYKSILPGSRKSQKAAEQAQSANH